MLLNHIIFNHYDVTNLNTCNYLFKYIYTRYTTQVNVIRRAGMILNKSW